MIGGILSLRCNTVKSLDREGDHTAAKTLQKIEIKSIAKIPDVKTILIDFISPHPTVYYIFLHNLNYNRLLNIYFVKDCFVLTKMKMLLIVYCFFSFINLHYN